MLANESAVWLLAANKRKTIGADADTMYRTGPQRVFEIAAFKSKHESVVGSPISAQKPYELYSCSVTFSKAMFRMAGGKEAKQRESFSLGYVDTALTVYDRGLNVKEVGELVFTMETSLGASSPYNSIYKSEAFTKKAGLNNTDGLLWLFASINDQLLNNLVDPGEVTEQNLTGKGRNNKGHLDLCLMVPHPELHNRGLACQLRHGV